MDRVSMTDCNPEQLDFHAPGSCALRALVVKFDIRKTEVILMRVKADRRISK
jgi:hypothetical protein